MISLVVGLDGTIAPTSKSRESTVNCVNTMVDKTLAKILVADVEGATKSKHCQVW